MQERTQDGHARPWRSSQRQEPLGAGVGREVGARGLCGDGAGMDEEMRRKIRRHQEDRPNTGTPWKNRWNWQA